MFYTVYMSLIQNWTWKLGFIRLLDYIISITITYPNYIAENERRTPKETEGREENCWS